MKNPRAGAQDKRTYEFSPGRFPCAAKREGLFRRAISEGFWKETFAYEKAALDGEPVDAPCLLLIIMISYELMKPSHHDLVHVDADEEWNWCAEESEEKVERRKLLFE